MLEEKSKSREKAHHPSLLPGRKGLGGTELGKYEESRDSRTQQKASLGVGNRNGPWGQWVGTCQRHGAWAVHSRALESEN